MEWKGRDADSKLGRTHPDIRLYVFYGPDTGLAAERAMQVARRHLGDPGGTDDILRLDGDTLAEDPARLSDEAAQGSMFGGERVILPVGRVREVFDVDRTIVPREPL